tara:strand:- start:75 stop:563 length:489 start_codon:yes stop_codon:yes gene_type:complete
MKYFKILISTFFILGISRLVPHPPNFTTLIALAFYMPIIFGIRYVPCVIVSLVLTDLIIGYHNLTAWTWSSIIFISAFSKFFNISKTFRFYGVSISVLFFYIFTNFGVWLTGYYGYTLEGLWLCYILAIPFLGNSFLSTIIFAFLIEIFYKYYKNNLKIKYN